MSPRIPFAFVVLPVLCALGGSAPAQSMSFSPRLDLAGDALIGAAAGDQTQVAIARGSSGYLVAFADSRAKLSTHFGTTGLSQTGLDIWARRLDANGAPLDAVPFALDVAPGDDSSPEVTWNGQNWLVSWVSQAPFASIYSSAIVGVRVAPSGQLLDPDPIVLVGYPSSTVSAYAVASDGANWVVVAQGTTGGSSDQVAARLSPGGAVLDPTPVTLLTSGSLLGAFDLAFAQGTFLLTWSDTRSATGWDVLGLRFDSGLQTLGVPFTIASTALDDRGAAVASNGAQFLVGFERTSTTTGQAEVQAVRVTAAGAVLDPTPIAVTGNLPYGNALGVAVAWDGAQWFASWTYSDLSLARISAAGGVLDFDGFPMSPPLPFNTRTGARLAGSGAGGVQVAWTDARAGSYEGLDVYGARVDGPASIGVETAISSGASAQLDVDLATDGANAVAVYRSEVSGNRRILAARLDPSGRPLDAEPIEIANGLHEYSPSVAFANGIWLVAWSRSFDPVNGVAIYARRMNASGVLLDANPILLGNGYTPEVAGQGDEFLVAWTRPTGFPELSFPNVRRVRASDGALIGGTLVINSTYAREPDVAVVGGRWAVVWQRNWSHDNPWADAAGALLNADGTLALTFVAGTGPTTYNYLPRIASSGNQALIVWQSGPGYGYGRRVLARRLDAAGTFADPAGFQVATGVNPQQVRPAVTWDGSEYVVAYEDTRAAGSMLDERTDVFAARVGTNGVVQDPAGLALEVGALPEHSVGLIGVGGGRGICAASILRPEPPFAAYRIGVRSFCGPCPVPVVYCTPKVNSLGCTPAISALGTPSASASAGYVLSATGLRNRKPGLLVYTDGGRAGTPFSGGFLCVGGTVRRAAGLSTGGTPPPANDCSGVLSIDMNAFRSGVLGGTPAAFLSLPGTVVDAQFWARDPGFPAPNNVQLSGGLEYVIDV